MIQDLSTLIDDSGTTYSSGQKQLICLARAAIARCKLLVLDEATANMDAQTDKMLHGVIAEIFPECTTLSIAHRLHSILNCDRVLVLDNGKIVEFDKPKILISQKDSIFRAMCEETKMD